ncbi:hypothetical protein HMPREF9151_02496 [Hoylesella saccharolytica F0055]|uniref:Uncharacterized protein n=1 Tax=Hoylesella saccharolytica F0055 TaxID=1127699 RepID=L1MYL3_9BACT|nr:hypothetical protein HMPREF9151_02496 [Hoylesella saccharolytica F0055]
MALNAKPKINGRVALCRFFIFHTRTFLSTKAPYSTLKPKINY